MLHQCKRFLSALLLALTLLLGLYCVGAAIYIRYDPPRSPSYPVGRYSLELPESMTPPNNDSEARFSCLFWINDTVTITNAQGQTLRLSPTEAPEGDLPTYEIIRDRSTALYARCTMELTLSGSEWFCFNGHNHDVYFYFDDPALVGINCHRMEKIYVYADGHIKIQNLDLLGEKYYLNFKTCSLTATLHTPLTITPTQLENNQGWKILLEGTPRTLLHYVGDGGDPKIRDTKLTVPTPDCELLIGPDGEITVISD